VSRRLRAALAFLLGTAGFLSAAPLRSNLDLVVDTVDLAAEAALARMDAAGADVDWSQPVWLGAQARHEANWLVEYALVERLAARGFRVVLDSTAAAPAAPRLRYRVVDLGVEGRSGLWGGQIQRHCRAAVGLSLTRSPDQTLLWRDEAKADLEDRVPKSSLALAQDTAYGFAKTDLEARTWGRFVEPAIVSSVLGGLIYLFFSNR
jgi:hypothetical protein